MIVALERIGLLILCLAVCSPILFPHTFAAIPRHDYLLTLIAACFFTPSLLRSLQHNGKALIALLGVFIFFVLAAGLPSLAQFHHIVWMPVLKEYVPLIVGSALIAYVVGTGRLTPRYINTFLGCCVAAVLLAFLQQITAQNWVIDLLYAGTEAYQDTIVQEPGQASHVGFGFGMTTEALLYPAVFMGLFSALRFIFSPPTNQLWRVLYSIVYLLALFAIFVTAVRTAWFAFPLTILLTCVFFRSYIVSYLSILAVFVGMVLVYLTIDYTVYHSCALSPGSTLVRGAQERFFLFRDEERSLRSCTKTLEKQARLEQSYHYSLGWIYGRQTLEKIVTVPSIQHRLGLQKQTLALWWDNPWLGVGPNNVQSALQQRVANQGKSEHYTAQRGRGISFDPHSTPLKILAEYGVLGLLLFLTPIGITLRKITQLHNKEGSNLTIIVSSAFFLALLLFGLSRTLIYLNYLWWVFGFWWGMVYYRQQTRMRQK